MTPATPCRAIRSIPSRSRTEACRRPLLPGPAHLGTPPCREGRERGEIAVDQTVKPLEGPSADTLVEGLTEELLARYEEVTLLHELSGAFGSVFDEPGLAAIALERTLVAIGAERGFVAFRHLDGESLTVAAVSEGSPEVGSELPLDEGISGQVARSGRSLIVHADREAPEPSTNGGPRLGEAVLSVPLCAAGDCDEDGEASLGVITLVGAPDGRFSAGEAKLATTIADQLAQAVRAVLSSGARELFERGPGTTVPSG